MAQTIGCIILARNGSERFPRKSVMSLGGLPMIIQLAQKCAKVRNLDSVIVATTTEPEDDDIEKLCLDHKVNVYRGPTTPQFERELGAVERFKLDCYLRMSGDAPFFDIRIARRLTDEAREQGGKPDFITVSGVPYDPAAEILPEAVLSSTLIRRIVERINKLREKDPAEYKRVSDAYARVRDEMIPGMRVRTHEVDISDILKPDRSPMKISIDYPMELVIAEHIINFLGRFPFTYDEVELAWKSIVTVTLPAPTKQTPPSRPSEPQKSPRDDGAEPKQSPGSSPPKPRKASPRRKGSK